MLLINATLSKNQLYKHKNQVNKFSTISKQGDIARALFQIYLHVILLMSKIYFRVIIMVGLWIANTRGLRLGIAISCFESFS